MKFGKIFVILAVVIMMVLGAFFITPRSEPKVDIIENTPPYILSNSFPSNGSKGVDVDTILKWDGGDSDKNDSVMYDIYFGISYPPPLVISNYSETSFNHEKMEYSQIYYWKIIVRDKHNALTEGPLWQFTTREKPNNPPYIQTAITPQHNSIDVDVTITISWTGGDPDDGDKVTYDVYFGTINPPPKVASNCSDSTYNPGLLRHETEYYWKIISWDNHGEETIGDTWYFQTKNSNDNGHFDGGSGGGSGSKKNNQPFLPTNPGPKDNETNVSMNIELKWKGGDPDDGDKVTYDVYFGTINPPLKVASACTEKSYNPGKLISGTTYYWSIVAWDDQGASSEGMIWTFTTIYLGHCPCNPNPKDGATRIDVRGENLTWEIKEPTLNDTITYDIYFGEINPPPKMISNQSERSYAVSNLSYNTTYYWKIVAWDSNNLSAEGSIWSLTTNQKPYVPNNFHPENNMTGIHVCSNLNWTGGDPDPNDILTYDIYFGTSNPPSLIDTNWSETSYDIGCMNYSTTYYWSVTARDDQNASSESPIQAFVTNCLPYEPHNFYPENNSTDINISVNLNWTGGDPDVNDTVTYEIHFGVTNPPPLIVSCQYNNSYEVGELNYGTTYYWKIISWDKQRSLKEGPTCTFTTKYLSHHPCNPNPKDGATRIDVIGKNLTWEIKEPTLNDTITYDIYFGEINPPPKMISNQSERSYAVSNLSYNTTYYWKIVAWDSNNISSEGAIWKFKTLTDEICPYVNISKPKSAIYVKNFKIFNLFVPAIIGQIDVEVNTSDESGIKRVEFYIDEELKFSDFIKPYSWTWDELAFGKKTIKVVSYDNAGNSAISEKVVWKFF